MGLAEKLNELSAQAEIKPITPSVTDKDYFVPESIKREIDGLVLTIENIKDFGEMGHRNFLFTGLQGIGKTLGALYIATRLGALVYDAKTLDSSEQVHETFKQLRNIAKTEKKPIFLVVNEIDKFSKRNELIDPRQRALLNTLLDEMQGFEANENIYVVGTTNRPNDLDPALRRPGRFDKEIEFLPPDSKGRLAILDIHARRKKHNFNITDEQLKGIAAKSFGYTGADLRGLLNEIFIESLMNKRREVKDEDIAYGMKHTLPSAIKDMPFKEPSVTLDDLVGYEPHKELLRRIITGNKGANMLFYGPPGTGKSVFAEALAGTYGSNLIFVSGSELESKWVGETKDRLAEVYRRAKHLAPCIVTLDEADSFLENKGWISHQKEQTGYMQSVLSKPIDGVYIIATTNNPQFLREVMLDRFMFKLYFGLPSREVAEKMLKKYLPEEIKAEDVKLGKISCRDIVSTCNKARTYGLKDAERVTELLSRDRNDEDYEKIIATIGDDVRDYVQMKGGKK